MGNLYKHLLIETLNPFWYYRLFKRKALIKEAKMNQQGHTINQNDANGYFEGSPLDMGIYYACILKIMFLTVFYGPLLPIAYPIGMISLSIIY